MQIIELESKPPNLLSHSKLKIKQKKKKIEKKQTDSNILTAK